MPPQFGLFHRNLLTTICLEIKPLLGETNFTLGANPELFFFFSDTVILFPRIGALRTRVWHLNRWPCHSLSESLLILEHMTIHWLELMTSHWFEQDIWDNFWQLWTILDNFDNFAQFWQFWKNFNNFGQFWTILDNFDNVDNFRLFWQFSTSLTIFDYFDNLGQF